MFAVRRGVAAIAVLNGLATAMAAGWQPLIVDWAAHKSYVKM